MMPLLAYLTKKPSNAKLIKDLYLGIHANDSSATQLLQLALTPSIERIISCGDYIDDSILTTIHGIVHESQQEFPHVRFIPAPCEFSDIYRKTLLLFKDSLETMCIPIDEESEHFAFNELADFTRLSKLTLSGYFDDMPHIDSILGKAHHLKDLVFDHCELDLYDDDQPTQQETLDWMKRKVQINQNAITVKLSEDTYPNYPLMEYLVYKYPNIKHLEVGKRFFQNGARHYERICRALSQIPSFTLKDQNNFESLLPHLKFFKGDKNVVKLMYIGQWQRKSYENDYGYHGYQGYYGYQSYYDDDDDSTKRYSTLERRVDQDQQRITEAQINIFRTLRDPSAHNSHARRLEDITAFVTDLQVDLVQGYDDDDFASEDLDGVANLESEIFFAALTYAHRLEKMKFRAHDIRTFKAAAHNHFMVLEGN
ncbi:hypothetical protein V8B55DRAFT_1335674 [Mucor lusitanicus]|uniref:Uncharacterized protein n=1 Tax=Mucor lusitanicus CBS 277.49 TaxID=747725 RepID=A0A168KUC7_MUCCL|nr:hypothetical protein MUCCIDRAFT_80800 [Mucor lusitanicus CBS 277.49]